MNLLVFILMLLTFELSADEIKPDSDLYSQMVKKEKKSESWYKDRNERSDIYYPHKAHYEVMEEEGDSCLLCHSFQENTLNDEPNRKALNIIANEALEQICHDCHVTELRGPWRCELCHDKKEAIWPADHNSGYIQNHATDARQDTEVCKTCHIDTKFCTDCHFRRDTSGKGYHPLGYRAKHGLEARMMPSNCSRCHNYFYCRDCHEQ